jgi:hypothetical protein
VSKCAVELREGMGTIRVRGVVVVRATPARRSPGEKSLAREMVQLKTAVGTALAYAGNLPG